MKVLSELDKTSRYKAIVERDKRYDGLFFFAVKTTGIYCRPSCPAPRPLKDNVAFYDNVDEARTAGYRACKRCHPDRLRDSEARAVMRAIDNGSFADTHIAAFAKDFNITARHLRRLVSEKTGTSPMKLKQIKRLETARLLLAGTHFSITDIAFSANFSSLRQFNHAFKSAFGIAPRDFRKAANGTTMAGDFSLDLKIAYKPPIEWQPLINGLKAHATPYLEHLDVGQNTLTRYLKEDAHIVKLTLDLNDYGDHVKVRVKADCMQSIEKAVARLRRLMDLDHDPAKANAVLARDRLLLPMVQARPGLRIVGSFSPFELMCFTIIGQQISVVAVRTFASRLVKAYGEPCGNEGLRLFPTAATLATANAMELYERTKINHKKVATLQAFAQLVAGGLDLEDPTQRAQALIDLLAIKGIGPWSVEYLALRGMGDPDAFPADDLLVKRRLGAKNAKEAIVRSETWRPYRGYGVMHIWTEGAYL